MQPLMYSTGISVYGHFINNQGNLAYKIIQNSCHLFLKIQRTDSLFYICCRAVTTFLFLVLKFSKRVPFKIIVWNRFERKYRHLYFLQSVLCGCVCTNTLCDTWSMVTPCMTTCVWEAGIWVRKNKWKWKYFFMPTIFASGKKNHHAT